ncbi:MAG: DUF115 domain-containing protein [Spirochaetota bacterium]|nr:DUF115 domain-containing protein [Spirochaetota bacterium]
MKEDNLQFSIENSRTGHPTLKYGENYIHSKYDPIKEGENLVSKVNFSNISCIIVFGMGLGYHITPLLIYDRIKIIIIEKNPSIIEALKQSNRLECFSNTKLFLGDIRQLENWIFQLIDEEESNSIFFYDHQPSVNLDKEYYENAKKMVNNILKIKLQSYFTTLGFSKRWHENSIKNLKHLFSFHTLNKKVNLPIFIIGSGPSLDFHLENLYEIKNRGIIIALSPVYHRLIEIGIDANFVISTDGGVANRIHIQPQDKLSENTVPITTLSATPYIFRLWNREKLLINHELPFEKHLFKNIPSIPMHGSVASAAFLLSQILTTGDIFLIGLDFAMPDNKYHFKGNRLEDYILYSNRKIKPFDTCFYQLISKFKNVMVQNQYGKMIKTNYAMQSYLNWFKNVIANSKQPVYTVNHKGAFIENAIPTGYNDIKKAIKPFHKSFNAKSILKPFTELDYSNIYAKLNRLVKDYQKIEIDVSKNTNWDFNEILNPDLKSMLTFSESRLVNKVKKNKILFSEDRKELVISLERTVNLLKDVIFKL